MGNAFIRIVRRVITGPRTLFRFAIANAMFVILVAKELVVQTADE